MSDTRHVLKVASVALLCTLPLLLTRIRPGDASPITGSGQPVSNEQPTLGLNYLIETTTTGTLDTLGQIMLFAGD